MINSKQPGSINNERMTFIDGLRGIACIMVILPHSQLFFYQENPDNLAFLLTTIASYGYLGVEIFFVISGFVIAYSIRKIRISNVKVFFNFFIRRLIRLTPPYYISIIIAMLALLIQIKFGNHSKTMPSFTEFLIHLFYLERIFNIDNLNVVYWTICIEVQFYLFFGLLLLLCNKLTKFLKYEKLDLYIFLLTFVVSLIFYYTIFILKNFTYLGVTFIPYWIMFGLGVVSFWIVYKKVELKAGIYFLGLILLISILYKDLILTVATLTSFSIVIGNHLGKLTSWLNLKIIQFFGTISYSLYLIHTPIMGLVGGISTRIFPHRNSIEGLICFLIGFLISTLLSTLMFYKIEVPASNWSHQLKINNTRS